MTLAIKKILSFGAKYVLVTLGKKGTLLGNFNKIVLIPTNPVKMVDATDAGDAFIGALLCKIQQCNCSFTFENIKSYVDFSNKVGAKTVTAYGAISSIPTLKEMNALQNLNI